MKRKHICEKIIRGEGHNVYDVLTINDEIATEESISEALFAFGDVVKKYPGEVSFESGVFTIPLTKEDTLSFEVFIPYQVTVTLPNGNVYKTRIRKIAVGETV